jgi:alcohol dehydrogenase (NADP+)
MTPGGKFQEHTITRRACSETDVAIDIQYAGICHSDIHTMREEWGPCIFPVVPGHEIAGVVVGVGSKVKNFTVGQRVGVGCMVGSCGECNNCKRGVEQYCEKGMIGTYNSRQRYPHMAEYDAETGGAPTYGGYSKSIVVDQGFVLHIPDNLDMAAAAPLLCAGITTYSPFMHYGLRPSHKVAILGLGGLGHMGAKFAVAMGCDVTIISRGTAKRESALNDLKVHHYLDSKDPAQLKAATNSFDFILDTVSADHDINMYVGLLNTDGKICIVGAPPATEKFAVRASTLFLGRRTMCGSLIGGVKETQEMLDFCGRHNITCDIELISADEIDKAYERTVNSDVKYRFVIDAATI